MIKNVLTIAGSDCSGGAGIQADLKTFGALGCYGMSVVTALTAQNTQSVRAIHAVPPGFVKDQIAAVFDDVIVDAVKLGMLANAPVIEAVTESLFHYKPRYIILDPVMVTTSGARLLEDDAVDAIKELMKYATLVTPNIPEAEILAGKKSATQPAVLIDALRRLDSSSILLKGGHAQGDESNDLLIFADDIHHLKGPRIRTPNTHGTGCTLSSAIAAYLATGSELKQACEKAKHFVTQALSGAGRLNVGQGAGPLHHFWQYDE